MAYRGGAAARPAECPAPRRLRMDGAGDGRNSGAGSRRGRMVPHFLRRPPHRDDEQPGIEPSLLRRDLPAVRGEAGQPAHTRTRTSLAAERVLQLRSRRMCLRGPLPRRNRDDAVAGGLVGGVAEFSPLFHAADRLHGARRLAGGAAGMAHRDRYAELAARRAVRQSETASETPDPAPGGECTASGCAAAAPRARPCTGTLGGKSGRGTGAVHSLAPPGTVPQLRRPPPARQT